MPSIALSEARIKALRSRPRAYDLRDAKLKGFGVRVLPSGAKRFFIHTQNRRQRVWKIVGDANAMHLDEARTRAALLLSALREGTEPPASTEETLFESVSEAVFRRCARIWKPCTLYVNRSYFRRQLLPWFGGRQIADISRRDVQRWFSSLRATPVAADRSAPVLSVIFKEVEVLGYRPEGSSPCWGAQALSPKGSGAVSVGRRDSPPLRSVVETRSRAPVGSYGCAPPVAHGVPQGRDSHTALVGLP